MSLRAPCCVLLFFATACATPGAAERGGGAVEVRGYSYADEAGLSVRTVGASAEQVLSRELSVGVEALVDQVVIQPPAPVVPTPPGPGQPTGHRHEGVDVITSASVLLTDTPARTEKWRVQGTGSGTWRSDWGGAPLAVFASARASTEPDYKSLSGRVGATVELLQRNLSLSGFLGVGNDSLRPDLAPPGQAGLWPATQGRLTSGLSLSQLLSPSWVGGAGLGYTHQTGRLSSPYRRASVQTTLFPEVMPTTRDRFTFFLLSSHVLGGGTALHLRQGFYADSWGVLAFIPEVALAKEVGQVAVVTFRYRHYGQGASTLYSPRYPSVVTYLSGDPRLGVLRDDTGGVELRLTPWGKLGWANSFTATASWDLSLLRYQQLGGLVRGQIFSLGVRWIH